MFCKYCGRQLNHSSIFCEQCGQRIENSSDGQSNNFNNQTKFVLSKYNNFINGLKVTQKTKKTLIVTLPIIGVLLLVLVVAVPLSTFIRNQISIIAYDVARELIKENMTTVTEVAYKAANEVIAENVPVIANDIATRIVADNMENVPDIVRKEAENLINEYDIGQAQREKERTLIIKDMELSTNSFFGSNSYCWSFTVPPSLHNVTIKCRASYGLETALLTRTEDDANNFCYGDSCDYVQGTVQGDTKTYYYEIGLPQGEYYFCVRGKTALYKIAGNQVQLEIVAKAQ